MRFLTLTLQEDRPVLIRADAIVMLRDDRDDLEVVPGGGGAERRRPWPKRTEVWLSSGRAVYVLETASAVARAMADLG